MKSEERRQKELAKARRWREAHPDRAKAASDKYNAAHPERRRETYRKYREKNRDKIRMWRKEFREKNPNYHIEYKYGISVAEFSRMIERQNGRCACCGAKTSKLCVDHCHKTGVVRELLCNGCNTAAGMLRDSHRRASKLAAYLRKHTDLAKKQMDLFGVRS